ncbi:hypothetical protein [Burkholderia gladioli]|nr:hypothetical protein [Burkholderia gladioli]
MAGSLRRWSGIARALPIIDRPQFLVARTALHGGASGTRAPPASGLGFP